MFRNVMAGCVLATVASMASAVEADVIMDATTHNGGLYADVNGTYWDNATTNPAEWLKAGSHVYNGASFIQAYPSVQVFNNTGETVTVGHTYTLSADIGDRELTTVDVYVRATLNSDGTGDVQDLAHVSRSGTPGELSSLQLYTVTDTGGPAVASLAGYYIQVLVVTGDAGSGQDHYFDNIVVTSEVPEPTSLALMLASGAMMLRRQRRTAA